MGQRNLVVDNLKFAFEGLFNPSEVYSIIAHFFHERGWDWYEFENHEEVTANGKQISLTLKPSTEASDYYALKMLIRISMLNLREVDVEVDNQTLKLHHGVIRMRITAYVISDRKKKWEEKPIFWFVSVMLEKFFFKNHYGKFSGWVKRETDDLLEKVKTYLNVNKYVKYK
jgi:hypothetical protein